MYVYAILLICIAKAAFSSSKAAFDGDKVLRIRPQTEVHVQLLKEISARSEIDVWVEPTHPGQTADLHIQASHVSSVTSLLKKHGIKYETFIDNLAKAISMEARSNQQNQFSGEFNYKAYNSYADIQAELRRLVQRFPHASVFSVGRTYEGRDMTGIKVTHPKSVGAKPAVFIDGGIHAREWISPATVMYFLNKLLTSTDPRAEAVLAKYDFYFLPVFNADGYEFTRQSSSNRLWRKTRSRGQMGCFGVDPNRNWGHQFGGAGTSANPCDDIYRGPSAFSEIEVANVRDFLRRIPNLKSYWNVHAYSQLVLTPWSYTTALPNDYAEISRVGEVFSAALRKRYGTPYRTGPPSRILYAVGGGSIDWTYAVLGVRYSYALELRDTGTYGFLLPAWQIEPTAEETSDGWFAALMAIR